ncbi:hypothetical protein SELMODRAFT_168625 [Selaginella moellendorffii]|uniref:Dihydrodipicolinate reductase C-terminal domain-containing protein n=1 Tax=Selaginella moellendorffii TaxID=88036 RepID=D8R728_SELML|nr:hypothetical protein SELMODRAFT_168625 [Selaginella moellendorffii]
MVCCSLGLEWKARPGVLISASTAQGAKSSSSNIKVGSFHFPFSLVSRFLAQVIVSGACKDIGKAAIAAISKARGMEVAGAIDTIRVGEDVGEVAGLEALEVPVSNNLVTVLGSLSQSRPTGVVVDFSEASEVLENVRQATAFGMRSVVAVPGVDLDVVSQLITFCEKASMGCVIAPTLSIGAILLQEAAIAASFHYSHVDIVESLQSAKNVYPSSEALRVAKSMTGMGRVYNDSDFSKEHPARGELVDDGIRIHSMVSPGFISSLAVSLSGPGEVFSLRHDITDVKALMPGLLVAIRRVIRLQSLVYGLEKIL